MELNRSRQGSRAMRSGQALNTRPRCLLAVLPFSIEPALHEQRFSNARQRSAGCPRSLAQIVSQ